MEVGDSALDFELEANDGTKISLKSFAGKNNVILCFYPKYDYQDLNKIHLLNLEPNKEVRLKVTRLSEYGERYKLFVINKNTFENKFNIEEYGINLIKDENKIVVDTLKWNGLAKKEGFETGDFISEFKIENLDRPNKGIVYPLAILLLIIFGYLNYRRKN